MIILSKNKEKKLNYAIVGTDMVTLDIVTRFQ